MHVQDNKAFASAWLHEKSLSTQVGLKSKLIHASFCTGAVLPQIYIVYVLTRRHRAEKPARHMHCHTLLVGSSTICSAIRAAFKKVLAGRSPDHNCLIAV